MKLGSNIVLLFFAVLNGGCSLFNFDSSEVVERSKETKPEWIAIETEPHKMAVDEQNYTFVISKDDILNFPVGAKEAQVEGMATSQVLFTDVVIDRINETAQSNQLAITNIDGMRQMTQAAVGEIHALYAAVGDLYFEKRADKSKEPPMERYHIYVKIILPKTVGPMLDQRLASDFAKSPYEDLRSLAPLLQNPAISPAPSISH